MAKTNGSAKRFEAIELRPRWSVKINHTPNKGRDYFTVSYYDENGKRQRRVFPELRLAQTEAEKFRSKMDAGLLPGILLSGRDRLIYERALAAAGRTGIELD